VLESALISASALSLLEGKAHIAGGSSFVLSASTHSLIAGSLLLLATFLAASGLVLKSLLGIELLLASTEHPVSTAILKQKLSNTIFLKWIPRNPSKLTLQFRVLSVKSLEVTVASTLSSSDILIVYLYQRI
jgi:hypothetical protein